MRLFGFNGSFVCPSEEQWGGTLGVMPSRCSQLFACEHSEIVDEGTTRRKWHKRHLPRVGALPAPRDRENSMRIVRTSIVVAGVVAAALGSWGCAASHRITRFDPTSIVTDADRAAYYALPRTVLQVSFEAKKVEVKKGDCFDALAQLAPAVGLPGSDPIWKLLGFREPQNAGVAFSVEGTPSLSVLAEPDSDQIFRADLSSSLFIKRKIELNYGPMGVLQSATSLAQDRTLDYAVSAVKLVAGAGILSVHPGFPTPGGGGAISPSCQAAIRAIHEDRELLHTLPEKVQAGAISKSEADWFKSALQLRIDKTLRQFVKGTESIAKISCLARPKANPAGQTSQDLELLSLREDHGFSPLSHGDCLIPGAFLSDAGLGEGKHYVLGVEIQAGQLEEKFASAKLQDAHDEKQDQGFYYRIPAMARATLRGVEMAPDPATGLLAATGNPGKQALLSSDVVVAQLGIVAALPAQRAYQTQYTITLDPMTGGLQKLSSESETPDPKLIGTLESALDEELKARADAKKGAAAATDELALLERERKLLEEQKKIRDLRNDLGQDGQ